MYRGDVVVWIRSFFRELEAKEILQKKLRAWRAMSEDVPRRSL